MTSEGPIELRPLQPADAAGCEAVMASLPDWFGDEDGLADCAKAVRGGEGWVAVDGGDVVGFLTLERPYPRSADITWLAVRADRRGGIGSALVERACAELAAGGCDLVVALTVSVNDPTEVGETPYAETRAFWAHAGFAPARDFPGYWEGDLPVLQVRALGGSG